MKNSDSLPRNPLDPFPVLLGIIPTSQFPVLLLPVILCVRILAQRPGLIKRIPVETRCLPVLSALLFPLKNGGLEKEELRGVRERERERERESRNNSFIQDTRWANQRAVVPGIPAVPVRVTQPLPETSDPTSTMRTAVYPHSRIVGDSPTNENSPFQIGLESSRFPGLYKPAVPAQQQDTWTNNLRARSSGIGPPSPSKDLRARSSGTGPRAGIVYPLQPRGRRPDVHITVEADLPEPAALLRPDLPISESPVQPQEAPANLAELHGDLVANAEETVLQRYSGQPNAHLHGGIGVTSQSPNYKQTKVTL